MRINAVFGSNQLLRQTFLSFFSVEKDILASQLVFGIFPVSGLRQNNSSELSFNLKSIQFISCALVQCGIAVMFSTSIFNQLNSQIEYTKVGNDLQLISTQDVP